MQFLQICLHQDHTFLFQNQDPWSSRDGLLHLNPLRLSRRGLLATCPAQNASGCRVKAHSLILRTFTYKNLHNVQH